MMTRLQREALKTLPISESDVERMYAEFPKWTLSNLQLAIRSLCRSHERLRMELAGMEVLLSEACPHCGPACDLKPARKP